MTVSCLWKVLDEAGCGIPIGISDLKVDGNNANVNNEGIYQGQRRRLVKTLAIDLSIWICEAMTCTATHAFHLNPVLSITYQRTIKLLKMGLRLVFVIEGVRNRQKQCEESNFNNSTSNSRRRRRCGIFWKECEKAENLLSKLGIPLLRAKTEGEALCALLNKCGLVDGIISNDSDCFLFGAKTVFKNFSIKNLESRKIVRFDDIDLRAVVSREDEHDNKDSHQGHSSCSKDTISLNRKDLIAFALLSGSDVVGEGLQHIGRKKAIRFIHICKESNALDEIRSWVKEPSKTYDCTICEEENTKKIYKKKHSCNNCKFKLHIQSEALKIQEKDFDPEKVMNIYFQDKYEVPCDSFKYSRIDIENMLLKNNYDNGMIIYGKTIDSSNDYVLSTLPKLLCRLMIIRSYKYQHFLTNDNNNDNYYNNVVVPIRIIKKVTHEGYECYEMEWSHSLKNNNNKKLMMIQTYEYKALIDDSFPSLINKLRGDERKCDRIRLFRANNVINNQNNMALRGRHNVKRKTNERVFNNQRLDNNFNCKNNKQKKHQHNSDISFLTCNKPIPCPAIENTYDDKASHKDNANYHRNKNDSNIIAVIDMNLRKIEVSPIRRKKKRYNNAPSKNKIIFC